MKFLLFYDFILFLGTVQGWKEFLVDEWVVKIMGGPQIARKVAEDLGYKYEREIIGFKNTYLFVKNVQQHQKRGDIIIKRKLNEDERVLWAERQQFKPRFKRINNEISSNNLFNDELWSQEWYLQDTRTRGDLPKLDLNVLPVYMSGITGKGVRVTILDDGIEYTHDDLKSNYDPEISYDCNENDFNPFPRYDGKHRNSHGTRCAGEIAMAADNRKCGVGIAFNAKIGGIKLLDGPVNDRIEGTALGYAHNLVDIYSASWGPSDDGKTVDGPGTLAQEAIERGIKEGRKGLGAIYVWASGNGGKSQDNCNCDGYIASPYTIAVGSASQRGEFPWYGEKCASTMAVTYSSGAYRDQMIATTDLGNSCTIQHTGTSAAAPLAAGIIALALEANPFLTWRDVQHLVVLTSDWSPVATNPGWQKNAAGLWFNTRFGFGLMNAKSLVFLARNWSSVPERQSCIILPQNHVNFSLSTGDTINTTFTINNCKIKNLEHVEVETTIQYSRRGALEIVLISAEGTEVEILGRRARDKSKEGFINWKFMSVMTWGEDPAGVWTLKLSDPDFSFGNNSGYLLETKLIIYGTAIKPIYNLALKYNNNIKYM